MKIPFILGYVLIGLLTLWSVGAANYEFLLYAGATVILLVFLHWTDHLYQFPSLALWGFDVWIVLHILGGLFRVGDGVLYSLVLLPLVDAPYSILKYDQVVHTYLYFVMAFLLWRVVLSVATPQASFAVLATITVLAAAGIGGLNEIVEFAAVVTVPETNVGGYENTAIDIVANTLGALLAVPFLRRV